MKVLPVHQLNYSGPLHAVNDCKKYSESAVGFVTQWKPSISAVKILAVHMGDKFTYLAYFLGPKMENSPWKLAKLASK